MMKDRLFLLFLCLVIPGLAVFGAGCLGDEGGDGTVTTDPGIEASYEVAKADAEEALTKLIEEEIAASPSLDGYSADFFYDGTPLTMVYGGGKYLGTEDVYYVFTFTHEMPSLKDPENVMDKVTITIVIEGSVVTDRTISMGLADSDTGGATDGESATLTKEPYPITSYNLAKADAAEALTRLIEEEIAASPSLDGYSADFFFNGTFYDGVVLQDLPPPTVGNESWWNTGNEGAPHVHTFRHEMPSLKDPENVRDMVTIVVVVEGGSVTDRTIGMGRGNLTGELSAE